MGDHLHASKPSQYITSHLGQLSLPCRQIEYQENAEQVGTISA